MASRLCLTRESRGSSGESHSDMLPSNPRYNDQRWQLELRRVLYSLGHVSTFGNFETITSTDLNLACLSWAILAFASPLEEKPKLSRFPVSGFSAKTVNASETSLSMAHAAFCNRLVPVKCRSLRPPRAWLPYSQQAPHRPLSMPLRRRQLPQAHLM